VVEAVAGSSPVAHLWRVLRTVPRTHLALRHSHDRYERVHHHWRVRWRSGADDHSLRPKRRGRNCQQLRANAALLIEWLMICWRENWMPDSRPFGRPDPDLITEDDGTDQLASLNRLRSHLGLDDRYGAKAAGLGIGELKPVALPAAEEEEDPTEPEEPAGLPPVLIDELPTPGRDTPGDAADVEVYDPDDPDNLPF
jgi:hypothetical protein